MQIGLIGAGNMARALARGWGRPVLCFDPVSERAQALAAETAGEVLASGAEVARRAELVVLCHKPAQLQTVAAEIAPHARAVASILAATPLAALREAYPAVPVYRFIPSLPVEVRQGAVVQAADPEREAAAHTGGLAADATEEELTGDRALDAQVRELFAELGTLVVLDDALVDVAMGLMSCAPAYVALVAEAQIDAGVRRGIPAPQGAQLVVQTLAGTAELLRRRDYDTLAVRREVTSPGGLTARGLDVLERGGVRAAFSDALDAVLRGGRRGRRRHPGPRRDGPGWGVTAPGCAPGGGPAPSGGPESGGGTEAGGGTELGPGSSR
jgi:pyrroline-5-carboxylate reductase